MLFIGTLRHRRDFVLRFFRDFKIELRSKDRRIAHVDRINKRLSQGFSKVFPNIIIQRNDRRKRIYYETIRIRYRSLAVESDVKPILAEFLKALRDNPDGDCYAEARIKRYRKRRYKGVVTFSPYLYLKARGFFSYGLCRAIRYALEYDF